MTKVAPPNGGAFLFAADAAGAELWMLGWLTCPAPAPAVLKPPDHGQARGGSAQFWGTAVDLRIGGTAVEMSFHDIVNDGLMTFFFFAVGLEVKHLFSMGELTEPARAVVPVAAAMAGLVVPAGIFCSPTPPARTPQRGVPSFPRTRLS